MQNGSKNGLTIAGGNGQGDELNQFFKPYGVYVYDDRTIYVSDEYNHRIMECRSGAINGRIVASGNGQGKRNDQLNGPLNLIVDKQTDSLLICDSGNKRIVRWPRQNGANGETIISRVNCDDLAMDKYGYIYVFDHFTQEGKRWKIGDRNGIVVAGRNEKGHRNDQLNYPTSIFVDQDQSVYVSDNHNHRVMQWKKATKEGSVIVGDKFGQGEEQLNYPTGLTFDPQNNLYVVDRHNRRIQKFNISN